MLDAGGHKLLACYDLDGSGGPI